MIAAMSNLFRIHSFLNWSKMQGQMGWTVLLACCCGMISQTMAAKDKILRAIILCELSLH